MLDFLRFYNRPQGYKAEIRVEVRNTGTAKAQGKLVVPVPRTTQYQRTVPVFKTPMLEYEVSLAPGERKVFVVPFSARVMARRYRGSIPQAIREANEFVMSYLTYGNPIDGLYTAEEAREKRVVDCGGFDALLQDELKKSGIASNIVAGFWSDGKMHAWLEIGNIPADPSVELLRRQGRTRKSGQLGFVGSDRIAFSVGEPFLQKALLLSGSTAKLDYETHLYCTRA